MADGNVKEKPKLPASYYPIQILLAIGGIVIGFWSWSWIEALGYKIIGKPDLWLFLIPMGLAIILVRIHRAIVMRNIHRNKNNLDREQEP